MSKNCNGKCKCIKIDGKVKEKDVCLKEKVKKLKDKKDGNGKS